MRLRGSWGGRGRGLALAVLVLVVVALAAGACGIDDGRLGTYVDDWRDEVIYQVVVDRFANGDPDNDAIDGEAVVPGDLARYQGGDWRGLREHLGYIQRLDATTIWISPVVAGALLSDALVERKLLWRVEQDGRLALDVPPRRAVVLVRALERHTLSLAD